MVASVNLPGSSYFRYKIVRTRAEGEKWLYEMRGEYQSRFGGTWFGAYSPARITSNNIARTWRYLDRSKVIREFDQEAR